MDEQRAARKNRERAGCGEIRRCTEGKAVTLSGLGAWRGFEGWHGLEAGGIKEGEIGLPDWNLLWSLCFAPGFHETVFS